MTTIDDMFPDISHPERDDAFTAEVKPYATALLETLARYFVIGSAPGKLHSFWDKSVRTLPSLLVNERVGIQYLKGEPRTGKVPHKSSRPATTHEIISIFEESISVFVNAIAAMEYSQASYEVRPVTAADARDLIATARREGIAKAHPEFDSPFRRASQSLHTAYNLPSAGLPGTGKR